MQQQDYVNLENSVFEKLLNNVPETHAHKEVVQEQVAKAFKEMTDEQKIMSLSEDEVRLLIDFRRWSASPGSASGVFHWRKQYGK